MFSADPEKVASVGSASEREIAPGQRRFTNLDSQNTSKSLDLFERKIFTVALKIARELLHLSERAGSDPHMIAQGELAVASENLNQPLFERGRLKFYSVAGLDFRFCGFQGLQQLIVFRGAQNGNLFECRHRDKRGWPT